MADRCRLFLYKLLNNVFMHKLIKILVLCLLAVISYITLINVISYSPEPIIPVKFEKYLKLPANYSFTLDSNVLSTPLVLDDANEKLEVINSVKYGPLDMESAVIVVLVRRDLERLQHLIVSLAQVRDISSVLIIFSHSYYDEQINYFVRLIDFCMVLQIYYPFSVQKYKYRFPGHDPQDRTFQRDARKSERKHHWWWTANFIFGKLPWAEEYKEMVIFIDEASLVLPDLLHVYRSSRRALAFVPDASVVSLGRSPARGLDYNKLTVDVWRPLFGNGLAFNASTWRVISALRALYCGYDDTSWSYSLQHLTQRFPRGRAVMVASMAPRVLPTAVLGSGRHAAELLHRELDARLLYPAAVKAVVLFGQNGKILRNARAPPRGNGGWGDSRDYFLCLNPFGNKTEQVLLHSANKTL